MIRSGGSTEVLRGACGRNGKWCGTDVRGREQLDPAGHMRARSGRWLSSTPHREVKVPRVAMELIDSQRLATKGINEGAGCGFGEAHSREVQGRGWEVLGREFRACVQ